MIIHHSHRTATAHLAPELLWLWRDRYGQLAILALVTGLLWLTGWGTPYVLLLALTPHRLGLTEPKAGAIP